MFERVNLENELFKIKEKKQSNDLDTTLLAFKDLFRAEWEADSRIAQTLDSEAKDFFIMQVDSLPANRSFTQKEIKALCTKYRLRFLPTKHFKAPFPIDALRAIKDTEKILNFEIKNFMIVAPSGMFKLEDANKDPLLFAPLSNGKYYLIHKWGNDMSWHRKLKVWPFKSFPKLLASLVILAMIISSFIPAEHLSPTGNYFSFGRFFFFLWSILTLCATTSFLWFTLNLRFSDDCWNSKNFN